MQEDGLFRKWASTHFTTDESFPCSAPSGQLALEGVDTRGFVFPLINLLPLTDQLADLGELGGRGVPRFEPRQH